MEVIQTEKKLCSCCMKEHEVKIVLVSENTLFNNTSVNFNAEYFYCENTDELYMDESMISKNDLQMKDTYRKNTGLLTSGEIGAIRTKYGISQDDLCILLGWGDATVTQYESHRVQDKAHDTILKKLDQNPAWFLCLLNDRKNSFSLSAYRRYFKTATALYERYQDSSTKNLHGIML